MLVDKDGKPSPDTIVVQGATGDKAGDADETMESPDAQAEAEKPRERFAEVHERLARLRDPESGGLAVYDSADMMGLFNDILGPPLDEDVIGPNAREECPSAFVDEETEEPEIIWSGKLTKGTKDDISMCAGYLHKRSFKGNSDHIKEIIEEIPEHVHISHRIGWSRTGFDHLLNSRQVVVMLRPNNEKDGEHKERRHPSRALFMGMQNSLVKKQQFGIMKFKSKKTKKRMAALLVPSSHYACDRLNIPWHVRREMDVNPTMMLVIGRKRQWKN